MTPSKAPQPSTRPADPDNNDEHDALVAIVTAHSESDWRSFGRLIEKAADVLNGYLPPQPSTRREGEHMKLPGPGCIHVGRIESLAPANPDQHRCRGCYGTVWPEGETASLVAALRAVSLDHDLYDDRHIESAAQALLVYLRQDQGADE